LMLFGPPPPRWGMLRPAFYGLCAIMWGVIEIYRDSAVPHDRHGFPLFGPLPCATSLPDIEFSSSPLFPRSASSRTASALHPCAAGSKPVFPPYPIRFFFKIKSVAPPSLFRSWEGASGRHCAGIILRSASFCFSRVLVPYPLPPLLFGTVFGDSSLASRGKSRRDSFLLPPLSCAKHAV